MRKKTCCVMGYLDIPEDKLEYVRRELDREITAALGDAYKTFITEFTEGVGILFARSFGGWKGKYPGVFWESILSRLDQANTFSNERWELLAASDAVKGLCADCRESYPLSVTRYMIEQSGRVIAVLNGTEDHDTLYAMDYAKTMGRDLRVIHI